MTALTERGLKEGLIALDQIRAILRDRLRDAEARLARADQDVTELRKLDSFAGLQADAMAGQLAAMTGEGAPPPAAL